MIQRVHPLTGAPKGRVANGKPRPEVAALLANLTNNRRARLGYDAARTGTDLDNHWAFADALAPDSANNRSVRQALSFRSRYEMGSNAYYAGIIETHANMVVGVGPTLRMLTKNRQFNQAVERSFFEWSQAVQLRRKLWSMCYARAVDGETFAILQTNPGISNGVQLDLLPIEAEQVQSPYGTNYQRGNCDGIHHDELGNVIWYEVLPYHPGSGQYLVTEKPVPVAAENMLHWYKMQRPGSHRGIPACTSSLNVGATSRRHREAVVAAAETAADIAAMLTTSANPAGSDEADPVAPFSTVEFEKRMLMMAPMGWDAKQMKGEHPNAQYGEFHRLQISELGRPLSMPYNAAACDSSTYSFASGKLDTLGYRAAIDVERSDCNDTCLDRIFAEWFREWTIIETLRDQPPTHQWDWPVHPVIDAVAEAMATDKKLRNGSITLRQIYSDAGLDLEDQISVMAEDYFGDASDENVAKMRQILLRTHYPAAIPPAQAKQTTGAPSNAQAVA
jgi:capsid protein